MDSVSLNMEINNYVVEVVLEKVLVFDRKKRNIEVDNIIRIVFDNSIDNHIFIVDKHSNCQTIELLEVNKHIVKIIVPIINLKMFDKH